MNDSCQGDNVKLVLSKPHSNVLRDIFERVPSAPVVQDVRAAVAYVSNFTDFFARCKERNHRLTIWARHDGEVPVAPAAMRWFLDRQSPSYQIRLVNKFFHPKVIHWVGFGVYIGSANLTDQAWNKNYEAGIFLTEEELIEGGHMEELNDFFDEIDRASIEVTEEIYQAQKYLESELRDARIKANAIISEYENRSQLSQVHVLTGVDDRPAAARQRDDFLREWQHTLTTIRRLAERAASKKFRPSWIPEDTPSGVQVDQFLHAYYHTKVRPTGEAKAYLRFHEQNKGNPERAEEEALKWWSELHTAPTNEQEVIDEWSPLLRKLLHKDKIRNLNRDEFEQVCRRVYAIRDHSLRVKNDDYGIPIDQNKTQEECFQLVAKLLWDQRSSDGKSIIDTWFHVLYGGEVGRVPERLWESITNETWKIPHCGKSALGELVGWAIPEHFPPRNDRTSKALMALGHRGVTVSG